MTWIHEHPDWPAFSWDARQLLEPLGRVRYRQGHLAGRLQTLGFELLIEAQIKALTDEVIHSASIEGEVLDERGVRSSIARQLGVDMGGVDPGEATRSGLVDVMLDATLHHDQPLTAERLFGWHSALFPGGHSGMRRITIGAWRQGSMQVVSGAWGREKIHFEAPAAERVPAEMQAFLQWFNHEGQTDGVLKAGLAHLWFVTIHPFSDGNGRIARALSELMLARTDRSPERFYSLSRQIDQERKAYYTALETQQRNGLDISAWLGWYLSCLERAIDSAETSLEGVLFKARFWQQANRQSLNERKRLVLNRLLGTFEGVLNSSKYAKLARCSSDTALRDIKELLDWGLLRPNPGGGRSTSYRLPTSEELAEDNC
jgi:Fic family protein